jgi:hypothetical protein
VAAPEGDRVRVRIQPDTSSAGWVGLLQIDGAHALEREVQWERCQDVALALALITVLRLDRRESEPAGAVAAGRHLLSRRRQRLWSLLPRRRRRCQRQRLLGQGSLRQRPFAREPLFSGGFARVGGASTSFGRVGGARGGFAARRAAASPASAAPAAASSASGGARGGFVRVSA